MHSLACSPLAAAQPAPRHDVADAQAVDAVIRGDREMFEVIVRRYNPRLYRVGMAYLRNHAQTEDAMQNAYLKAFLHLHQFRASSGFATWLIRIMINECLMTLRSRKRAVLENIDDVNFETLPFVTEREPLRGEEIKAVLEQAVQTLPRLQRAVYMLREVQQLSTGETATCLGISKENVKVTLHRAREALKERLIASTAVTEIFDYPAAFCDPMTTRVMRAVQSTHLERR